MHAKLEENMTKMFSFASKSSDFKFQQKEFTYPGIKESVNDIVRKKQKGPSMIENQKTIIRYFETHTNKISYIDELLSNPEAGQQFRIITQNSFNSFTFILKLIRDFGFINDIFISTYNISQKTLFSLETLLIDGSIENLTLIVSESIQFRTPERAIEIEKIYSKHKNKMRVAMIWNHSKITLCKINDNYFCIEGSGNLSDNARIEQYIYENNKDVYEFHSQWMNELLEKKILLRHKILK